MKTNGTTYTVIYTTLVCVLVAAILAVVSQTLKPRQAANEKAGTVRAILTAAGFGDEAHWQKTKNAAVLDFYRQNIQSAILVDASGKEVGSLDCASAQVYTTSDLKAQNYNIKDGSPTAIPVYRFKNGISVLAVYGAGLWGPIWGHIALESDAQTVAGACFDHESETPGLGGKIKDDPAFRASFKGKKLNRGGQDNLVDAISGATMTSKGLDAAIDTWMEAYKNWLWAN